MAGNKTIIQNGINGTNFYSGGIEKASNAIQ